MEGQKDKYFHYLKSTYAGNCYTSSTGVTSNKISRSSSGNAISENSAKANIDQNQSAIGFANNNRMFRNLTSFFTRCRV